MIHNLPPGFGVGRDAQLTAEELRQAKITRFVDTVKAQRDVNGFNTTYDKFMMERVGIPGPFSRHFPPFEAQCGQRKHFFNDILFSSFVELGEAGDVLLLHGRRCHGKYLVAVASMESGETQLWEDPLSRTAPSATSYSGSRSQLITQIQPAEGSDRAVLLMTERFYFLQTGTMPEPFIGLDDPHIQGQLLTHAETTRERMRATYALVAEIEETFSGAQTSLASTPVPA